MHGSHTALYEAYDEGDNMIFTKVKSKGKHTFEFKRMNYNHPTNSTCQRVIAFVTGMFILIKNSRWIWVL